MSSTRKKQSFRSYFSVTGWIGLSMTLSVLLIALIGPLVTPQNPDDLLGLPFGVSQPGALFGFDSYGRDSFSRFLAGGRYSLVVAIIGYLVGASLGLTLGLLAAYSRGWVDAALAWTSEVLIGFPALVLMLLLVAGLGTSFWVLVVALASVNAPRILRIVRASGREVRDAAYVEVAEARGEPRRYIMFKEIFPSVLPAFLVDAGVRIPASILLVASLSFLGLGIQPPASDWGLIISENRVALTVQPLAVMGPIVALALLMIGMNLALDGFKGNKSSYRRDIS